ncbi:DUF2785 domain-containing protein [Levilactobacillus bambusae]|nr:DUF2785 domain-containing protein [Levilactobacillus bambusae]
MDDGINDLQSQVANLKDQLERGEVFQSLGSRIKTILEGISYHSATPVKMPSRSDGVIELSESLEDQMQAETLTGISDEAILKLMQHLGSPNPDVRDSRIYFFFNDALQMHLLDSEQLRLMVNYLLDPRVIYSHVLEEENDAVFKRSYDVLLLSVLTYADRSGYDFLDDETVDRIVIETITYALAEKDTRGFVGNRGWAHTFSHIPNLMDDLSKRPELPRADKLLMMAAFIERYKTLTTPLIFGESERIAGYLANLANKNSLYEDYLLVALKEWRLELTDRNKPTTEGAWNQIFNRSRLMSAMMLRHDFSDRVQRYLNSVIDFLA